MCKRILSTLLLCFWMCMIFNFSAQPAAASSKLSSKVETKIVRLVTKVSPKLGEKLVERPEGSLTVWVRKSAHFFLYLVLGALAVWTAFSFGIEKRRLWIAFFFCLFYAGSDEFHQIYVPGRAGRLLDVGVDTAGSAIGIILFHFSFLKKKRKRENFS